MKKLLLFSSMIFLLFSSNAIAQTTLKLLEVISSPERTQLLQEILDEFEENNKDIKVEIISIPWDKALEKIVLMAGSENAPDVIEMPDRWLALFVGGGLLYDLEDKIKNWPHVENLEPKAMGIVRNVGGTYTIPYGLYLRALFYNIKLLKQAGFENPPHTMSEFMEVAAAVSKLPGKWGYCLRGGLGGLNGWFMMAAAMNGTNDFFTKEGKSTLNEPNAIKGLQFLIDLYQKGYAPSESIDWDFNDVVTNFSMEKCALLDQDPDAVNLILKNMDIEDFAVTTMPIGPQGKAFPTVGFTGWSITKNSKKTEEAWKLLSFLSSPKQHAKWLTQLDLIPIHKTIEQDNYLKEKRFSGWSEELHEEAYHPTVMPLYLEQFANFEYSIAQFSSREALLGQRSAKEVADLWAEILTKEYAKWKSGNN